MAVELTDAGRHLATPLLAEEQARSLAQQRATQVKVLPLVPAAPADGTATWFCQLETALASAGIDALTDSLRETVVIPAEALRSLPAPARLLHVLRESPEAFPLTAAGYEEDTEAALADLLGSTAFTPVQAQELQQHRIRWPQMDAEDLARRELGSLLDGLEQRRLYCDRERLTEIVFSPARDTTEPWTAHLRWLLGDNEVAAGFGFRSGVTRGQDRALAWLAGYVGRDAAEQLATVIAWNGTGVEPAP